MDRASEVILSFRPVTFHYKTDAKGTPQFGLIAEEVAEVNPDLIVRDKNGDIYSVRYDAVNAMLLNEFLKEHKRVEQQQSKIEKQEETIAALNAKLAQQQISFAGQQRQIEALTTGLQKVSAQLETTRSAPHIIASEWATIPIKQSILTKPRNNP